LTFIFRIAKNKSEVKICRAEKEEENYPGAGGAARTKAQNPAVGKTQMIADRKSTDDRG
jgi:hypothetical protein